jgi:hypothetical protein
VAWLLDSLRAAGAQDQVTLLVDQLPSEGLFDFFCAKETIRRGIGSAGTPMGAQPSHGTGKI